MRAGFSSLYSNTSVFGDFEYRRFRFSLNFVSTFVVFLVFRRRAHESSLLILRKQTTEERVRTIPKNLCLNPKITQRLKDSSTNKSLTVMELASFGRKCQRGEKVTVMKLASFGRKCQRGEKVTAGR
ncbi:hypothetical protein AVEN_197077-1 [Araneus ventricosus]|uniref:Uncharacterized protein n=1 Tax=Araneus ventricosus TaxID=182803 RepID=A0A4Y2NDE2_ARAVE|nr:hypothetical protein AVEN_197077-1 [Araneus ventricosus]